MYWPNNPRSTTNTFTSRGVLEFVIGFCVIVTILAGGTVLERGGFRFGRWTERIAILVACVGLVAMVRGMSREFKAFSVERRVRGLAIQSTILVVFAGAAIWVWTSQTGSAIPGDALAPLVGKSRDDPEVAAAMTRLGRNRVEADRRIDWTRHNIVFAFDDDKVLKQIDFGVREPYRPFDGDYPFALPARASPQEVRRVLGEPEFIDDGRKTEETWHYADKKAIVIITYGKVTCLTVRHK